MNRKSREREQEKPSKNAEHRKLPYAISVAAVVISLGSLYQSCQGNQIARQSNETAQQSNQTANKAELGVGPLTMDLPEAKVGIPINNYGKNPSPWISLGVREIRKAGNMIIHTSQQSFGGDRTEVAPGTGQREFVYPLEGLRQSEEKPIARGEEIVTLDFALSYDDSFGHIVPKFTCFAYTPTDPFVKWTNCPVYTSADMERLLKEMNVPPGMIHTVK